MSDINAVVGNLVGRPKNRVAGLGDAMNSASEEGIRATAGMLTQVSAQRRVPLAAREEGEGTAVPGRAPRDSEGSVDVTVEGVPAQAQPAGGSSSF